MTSSPLLESWSRGLIAAPHTPFDADGGLWTPAVVDQARHLAIQGIQGVFVGGSTGESTSMDAGERLALVEAWVPAAEEAGLELLVHVSCDNQRESRALAAHAQEVGAAGISCMASRYFRPGSVGELVDWCAAAASAAPALPFYLYDIPVLTNVHLPVHEFLELGGSRIPNLAGVKYTSSDGTMEQRCLAAAGGRFQVLHGNDETLLSALAMGVHGAVGSTYNFAAPLAQGIQRAFAAGDLQAARRDQLRLVHLVDTLAGFGYLPAARATMGLLGVEVGPSRAPHARLEASAVAKLRDDLVRLGFFDWIGAGVPA